MSASIETSVDDLAKAVSSKTPLVFLAGAGVSYDPPSCLSTWPGLTSIVASRLSLGDVALQKNLTAALAQVRPELFFQILYNHLSENALMPLDVLDPFALNAEEPLVHPNANHYFLAEMLLSGHIVLTTNFDDMIERAFLSITSERGCAQTPPVVVLEADFERLTANVSSSAPGRLIKIHGSFQNGQGADCRHSIVATLQQVHRQVPGYKRSLLKGLIDNYDFVVLGYSGQDDYDLFSFFLNPPSERALLWIRHSNSPNPKDWLLRTPIELNDQNRREGPRPAPLRDYGKLNPNAIVLAYGNRGQLIEAHTGTFIAHVGHHHHPPAFPDNRTKVRGQVEIVLDRWVGTISEAVKHLINAGIFDGAGKGFLDEALTQIRAMGIDDSRKALLEAHLLYKKSSLESARVILEGVVANPEVPPELLGSAWNLMALIYNGLAGKAEGLIPQAITSAEKAGNVFSELVKKDEKYAFDLALALRALALTSMRAIPDLSSVDDPRNRHHCESVLMEACRACDMSGKLLDGIGNRSGERGQAQSHNVLGLIKLKLGRYEDAASDFEKALRLAGPSRFLRESFQAYRNLGLARYHLAGARPSEQQHLLKDAIQQYDLAMACLGGEVQDETADEHQFNVLLNRCLAFLALGDQESAERATDDLLRLLPCAKLWHWECRVLGALVQAAVIRTDKLSGVLAWMEKWLATYEAKSDDAIAKMLYGVQNARETVRWIVDFVEKNGAEGSKTEKELLNDITVRTKQQGDRFVRLKQHIPDVPIGSYENVVSLVCHNFDPLRQSY